MTAPGRGNPLRLLHVIDGLGVGGAEVQLVLLLRHLPREEFAHVVCHVGPRDELAGEIRDMGIPVVDLSVTGRRALRAALHRVRQQTAVFQPDLIHADGLYANPIARAAGLAARVPVLTTMGNTAAALGVPWPPTRLTLARWTIVLGNRLTGRLSRHFMAITAAVRESVVRFYHMPADRVSVVYRGLDLESMVPAAPPEETARLRAALVPPDSWPVLLNVGRLARQKGQEYLLRALPAIRRRYPRAFLLVAGEGLLREHYRRVAAEVGVADAVRFLGRRSDVKLMLQAADLFVFPSLYEGTGVSLLEAMAMRRPIVASRIPVLEEVVDGGAVLVPPRDPAALADGIVHLCAHPGLWEPMTQRARRVVEARFDIRQNAAAFGRLCRQVVEGTARPAEAAVRLPRPG